MSKISTIIGASSFEIVRDKIAEILAVEIANQRIMLQSIIDDTASSESDILSANFSISCLPSKVWVERFTRPTPGEIDSVWINVMFAKRKKSYLQTISHQHSENTFVVEAWSRGASTTMNNEVIRGDTLSSKRLSRTLSVCSQILKSKHYDYLDMPKCIGNLDVAQIDIAQPEYGAETSENLIFGSMCIEADLNDKSIGGDIGVLAAGVDTTMVVEGAEGIYWKTNLI